ncbi:gamma-glutamyltransferase [Mycolicibacterium rhodesiae JS60]|nr:gamma-glutamyltransferase [Mycolicibacterium rhodesiae JS60]
MAVLPACDRVAEQFRQVVVPLIAVVLVAAACGTTTDTTSGPPDGRPCDVVANGTPTPKTPVAASPNRDIGAAPEIATGYRSEMTAVRTRSYAAATANPLATQAACRVLKDGGTAVDAVVAAQAVLGLAEPQSSGIGGGGFLLHYDASSGAVQAYDGRETAPAAATENYLRWISDADRNQPRPDARASGRSIGVPGLVRMLAAAHEEHGRTPWRDLFAGAISLADNGFEISPRLAAAIAKDATKLALDPASADYFLNPDRTPKAVKAVLTNPAYAKTLGAIASDPANFYRGAIAEDIVESTVDTSGGRTPGAITTEDLADYRSKIREPLCISYRDKQVCGVPPPSAGGIAVAQILGMLEFSDLARHRPTDVDRNGGRPTVAGVHLVAEVERLAYADRDRYVADTDFVPLPGGSPQALLGADYLAGRAALISPQRSMGTAKPGDFGPPAVPAPQQPEHGTTQVSVIDKDGNAASFTSSIEAAFGSFHMVDGFLLNNQLTDFSADPVGPDGVPVANRVQPGKRPRSSMAPTLVFDQKPNGDRGALYAVVGSPGGSTIIQYVTKTLVGVLDWGLDPQQAVSMVDFGAANTPKTNVGGEHPVIDTTDDGVHDPLVEGLRKLGHDVNLADQSSGLSAIVREPLGGWIGGADPRREGAVMGDAG